MRSFTPISNKKKQRSIGSDIEIDCEYSIKYTTQCVNGLRSNPQSPNRIHSFGLTKTNVKSPSLTTAVKDLGISLTNIINPKKIIRRFSVADRTDLIRIPEQQMKDTLPNTGIKVKIRHKRMIR